MLNAECTHFTWAIETCWIKRGTDPTKPLSFPAKYTQGNVCGYFSSERTAVTTTVKLMTTKRVPGKICISIIIWKVTKTFLFWRIKKNLTGKSFGPQKVNICLQMTANFKLAISQKLGVLIRTICVVKNACS